MKKILLFVAALAVWAACENKPAGAAGSGVGSPDTASVAQENRQDRTDEPRETNYFPAIDRYLVNVFGKRYAGGEHCVPIHSVVSVDERNSEDILVWVTFCFKPNTPDMGDGEDSRKFYGYVEERELFGEE